MTRQAHRQRDPVTQALEVALLHSELLALREADAELARHADASSAGGVAHPTTVSAPAPPEQSWRRWAACKDKPTHLWFPARGDTWAARAAIAVCEGCGVREPCLAAAIAEEAELPVGEVCGIRGGLLPWQRLSLAGRRRRQRLVDAG